MKICLLEYQRSLTKSGDLNPEVGTCGRVCHRNHLLVTLQECQLPSHAPIRLQDWPGWMASQKHPPMNSFSFRFDLPPIMSPFTTKHTSQHLNITPLPGHSIIGLVTCKGALYQQILCCNLFYALVLNSSVCVFHTCSIVLFEVWMLLLVHISRICGSISQKDWVVSSPSFSTHRVES